MGRTRVPATRTKAAAKLFTIVVFGLALSLSGSARVPTIQAYVTYGDARWPDYDLPVIVNLEEVAQGLGSIRPDEVRAEITKAMDTWNSVGTRFRFVEGFGASAYEEVRIRIGTPAEYPELDPETYKPEEGILETGSIYAATGWASADRDRDPVYVGRPPDPIRGAVITINEEEVFSTSCPPPNDAHDLQTTALHELGHALGLDHTEPFHREAVMWRFLYNFSWCRREFKPFPLTPGDAPDDIQGLISLYGPITPIPPASTPLLVSPADGTTIIAEQTELDWEDSSNAVSYYIQVSESADFLVPVFMDNPVQSSVASIPGLGPEITYYWRVKARGTGGNSTWSEIREFAIGTGAPALAAVLYEQSEFPMLEPGEETEIYFALQNVGSQTWEAGHYALVHVNGQPLGARPQMALSVDVPSGSSVTWRFTITAPVMPGVYRTEWRFSYDGQLIGPLLWTDVIVVPPGSDDLTDIIRRLIEEARQDAEDWLEKQWEELRRRIIELIEAEIRRRIEEFLAQLCSGSGATVVLSLSVMWLGRRRSRIGNRER